MGLFRKKYTVFNAVKSIKNRNKIIKNQKLDFERF